MTRREGRNCASHGEDAEKWRENALKNPYWKGRKEQYPDYGKRDILLLTGDGSLQMNLQELQTIIHHRLPIKIFVINNGGYHSIRQTERNFFGEQKLVGIGSDSGDLRGFRTRREKRSELSGPGEAR